MKDLLTVIVPIYNVEKYLNKCINSIINQTYSNLEILLIDDGSTDNSGTICDNWEKKDKRIKVIHKKNGGVGSARNVGIKIANGKYISFIDGDDYIALDMYEFLMRNMKLNKCDVSICSCYDVKGDKIFHNKIENIKIVMNNIESLENLYKENYYGNGLHNKLFNSSLLKNNFFPIGIKNGEEILVLFKALKNSNKVVYESVPKYYYVNRSNSATHKGWTNNDACKNIERLIKENKEFLDENYNIKKLVYNSYYNSLFQLYDHCILYNGSKKNLNYAIENLKTNKNNINYKNLVFYQKIQYKLFFFSKKIYNVTLVITKKLIKLKEKNK